MTQTSHHAHRDPSRTTPAFARLAGAAAVHASAHPALFASIQQTLEQVLSETFARMATSENLQVLLAHAGRGTPPAPSAPRGDAGRVVAPPAAPPSAALLRLSTRESEVLQRIAAGDSNKVIARALDLSPHTVKRHVANILGKLEATSRGHAAALMRGQADPGNTL